MSTQALKASMRSAGAPDDNALATALASAAGRVLLTTRDTALFAGRDLGATGDAVSQQLLAQALRIHRPLDAVLSEEGIDETARVDERRVWIIDPLDGTREYGEGRDDWAVHVALTIDGLPGASAVGLPGLGVVMSSSDAAAPPPVARERVRIAVSRSRAPALAERVAAKLGADLVAMGSAGFKAMAVVRGDVDAYIHAGGQYEWDSAAPVGVAAAAGLHTSRLDGSPLVYNQPDPLMPDLVICRQELAEELLVVVAAEEVLG